MVANALVLFTRAAIKKLMERMRRTGCFRDPASACSLILQQGEIQQVLDFLKKINMFDQATKQTTSKEYQPPLLMDYDSEHQLSGHRFQDC